MIKLLRVVFAFALFMGLAGCATLFGDNDKNVQVNTVPEGAQVYLNNMPVGATPTTVALNSTWSPSLLTFKKPGYAQQTAQINPKVQPITFLNILFWPGFLVDAISGDMMKVPSGSHAVNVNLARA